KLATYLNNFSNLKIITNNLIVASQLQNHMNFSVFISGGLIKPYSQSVLDNEAIRFIHQFKTKYAFVSCSTIDLSGLYMADLLQAQVKREAIKQSEKTVALIDSSKFKNNQDFIKLCDLSDIDILITDKKITDTKFINFCKVHNIQIINS
ncbi:MAG: DeoR/GlpR transcriptional regulator, partial [Lactobacillus iners]|nr:DeoR/GlpR transcriptional regulator [Lactobacillus iners]